MTNSTEEMLHAQLRTANLQADMERGTLKETQSKLLLAETSLRLANDQVELGNRTIRALRAFVWFRPMYSDPHYGHSGWRCSWCGDTVKGNDEGHKRGCVYMAAIEVVGRRPGGLNPFEPFHGKVTLALIEQARNDFHNKGASL